MIYKSLRQRQMTVIKSWITGQLNVCFTGCSLTTKRYQRSMLMSLREGKPLWSVDSLHNGTETRKMFPFADVIMISVNWVHFGSDNGLVPVTWTNDDLLSIELSKPPSGNRFLNNSWAVGLTLMDSISSFFFCIIAQIAPLSFQGSHRTQTQTSEVRWLHASVVTEWSPACLHKQFPGDLHRGN